MEMGLEGFGRGLGGLGGGWIEVMRYRLGSLICSYCQVALAGFAFEDHGPSLPNKFLQKPNHPLLQLPQFPLRNLRIPHNPKKRHSHPRQLPVHRSDHISARPMHFPVIQRQLLARRQLRRDG